ncbi:MAG: hypothetical protein U1E53_28590 [Dongiaceae bacterium]
MTKKTLRNLLATTALAAVALTFTLQPAHRALAGGGLPGATGTNGTSLDGVAPESGCDARSASAEAAGSVVVASGGPGGTGGINGVSLDGIDARAACRSATGDR